MIKTPRNIAANGAAVAAIWLTLGISLPASAAIDPIDELAPAPANHYSVQVYADTSSVKAAEKHQVVSRAGYSPVEIVYETPFHRVCVGSFSNYPDAARLRDELKVDGISGFIRTAANQTGAQTVPTRIPRQIYSDNVLRGSAVSGVHGPDPPDELAAALEESDPAAMKAALDGAVSNMSDSSPAKGQALLYFALADERQTSSASVALPLLEKVVRGQVAAAGDVLVAAALHRAAILHYTKRDFIAAHRAYKDLLTSGWLNEQEMAEVTSQLAATYLELMDSEKGKAGDVRFELSRLYASVPSTFTRERGTIELIYAETYFWEKDRLEDAMTYMQHLQLRLTDHAHLLGQAIWNEGVALERMGETEFAIRCFERVANLNIAPETSFNNRLHGRVDIRKRAAIWLSVLEQRRGNSAGAQRWQARVHDLANAEKTSANQLIGYGLSRAGKAQ